MSITNKGTHLNLFPMHAIAKVMSQNGYEFPDARRWVLRQTCYDTGSEITMSPKFHECFNYVSDILAGRFILDDATSHTIRHIVNHFELPIGEEGLTLQIMTYLEPAQLATLKPMCDLAFSESEHKGVGVIVSLKQILTNIFAETFGLFTEINSWVYSDLMQIALLLALKDVLAHWSNR